MIHSSRRVGDRRDRRHRASSPSSPASETTIQPRVLSASAGPQGQDASLLKPDDGDDVRSRAMSAIPPIFLTALPACVYSPSSLQRKKEVRFHGYSSCRNLEFSLLAGVGAYSWPGSNSRPQAGGAFSQD